MKKCSSNQSTRRRAAHSHRGNKRENRRMKNYYMILLCIILSIGILGTYNVFSSGASVVHAEEHLSSVQYKVVEIKYGDSLWSIAEDNMGPGYSDVQEYMEDIQACNQLSDADYIRQGANLLIPYYTVN